MSHSPFTLRDKIVHLRFTRMGRIPPALSHAQIQAEHGLPVLALEYGYAKEEKLEVAGKVPRRRLESPWQDKFPSALRQFVVMVSVFWQVLKAARREGKPSVFVGHGLHEQILAAALGKLLKVPYVIHVHEPYERSDLSRGAQLIFPWEGMCLRNADFLIFPEATRIQIYKERYNLKNQIFLVYNCARLRKDIKKRDLRADYQIPANAKILGYLGGIGDLNTPKQAIEAVAMVPNVYFLLWGWGFPHYLEELRQLAKEKGVADRVKLVGEVDTEQKLEALAGCDISYCVYTWQHIRERYQATASNKLMESIACGVPLLTNSRPDFKAVVEKYDVGVCAASLDPNHLAAALRQLVNDDLTLKRQSLNGRKAHLNDLNFEHQFQPVLARYRELLGVASSPGRYGKIS